MKQQYLLTAGGLILLATLFFFGKIETQKSNFPHNEPAAAIFNIDANIKQAKQKLTPSQLIYVSNLENGISRGDIKQQGQKQYTSLASFWRDSAQVFEPYAWYLSQSAKLDNSEKNLTFAARLIFEAMRKEDDVLKKTWEAGIAADLFEGALKLDPSNDDLKIGLGSCYVYGKGMIGDAAETMKGVQQLLQVVRKDSANMKAQLVLGIGGVISRQYDKAIERLNKVVKAEPGNMEAVSWLADAYAATGNKADAVKWYEYSKRMVNNPAFSKEVDERIKGLN
ncbi:MAG: tetratricopeptide repeat protein [Chitinophagaceae bacterium]|nr:tetratricopeptide repeat protein [Chitinophagaceae bacterium]